MTPEELQMVADVACARGLRATIRPTALRVVGSRGTTPNRLVQRNWQIYIEKTAPVAVALARIERAEQLLGGGA